MFCRWTPDTESQQIDRSLSRSESDATVESVPHNQAVNWSYAVGIALIAAIGAELTNEPQHLDDPADEVSVIQDHLRIRNLLESR